MTHIQAFFDHLAVSIKGRLQRLGLVHDQRFRARFDDTDHALNSACHRFHFQLHKSFQTEHILWACFFLKQSSTEHIHTGMDGADEKTSRSHAWVTIKATVLG